MKKIFLLAGFALFLNFLIETKVHAKKHEAMVEPQQQVAVLTEVLIPRFGTNAELISQKEWEKPDYGKPNTKKIGRVFVPPKLADTSAV